MKNKKYKNKKVGFQNCLYLFQFHKKNFLLDPATNSETTNRGSFLRRQLMIANYRVKKFVENLSNHNKHKPTFANIFVFKTKRELKCQNELFFNIIKSK